MLARASIDTTTANGRLVFAILAGVAEFERELIVERTKAGLASARARGQHGGRAFNMTPAKLRLAQAAMGKPETKIAELCAELGVTRQTLYRHVAPDGQLRPDGAKLLGRKGARKLIGSARIFHRPTLTRTPTTSASRKGGSPPGLATYCTSGWRLSHGARMALYTASTTISRRSLGACASCRARR